jgi:hypothetical protein
VSRSDSLLDMPRQIGIEKYGDVYRCRLYSRTVGQPDNCTRQIDSHKLSVTDAAVNPSGEIRTFCRSGSKGGTLMRHTQSTAVYGARRARPDRRVGVSLEENDADGNRTRRTAVRRSHLVRDWKSRSFLLRGARSRGCTLPTFFGVMPAAHIDSQTIRLMRSP